MGGLDFWGGEIAPSSFVYSFSISLSCKGMTAPYRFEDDVVDIFLQEVGGNTIEIDMALGDISRRANVEVMSKTNRYVVSILFNKINNRLRVLGKGEEILPLGFKGNKVLVVRRSDGFKGGSNGRFVGREVEKKFRFGEGKERKEKGKGEEREKRRRKEIERRKGGREKDSRGEKREEKKQKKGRIVSRPNGNKKLPKLEGSGNSKGRGKWEKEKGKGRGEKGKKGREEGVEGGGKLPEEEFLLGSIT